MPQQDAPTNPPPTIEEQYRTITTTLHEVVAELAAMRERVDALDIVAAIARYHRDTQTAPDLPPIPDELKRVCDEPRGQCWVTVPVNGKPVHRRIDTPCDATEKWRDIYHSASDAN